MNVASVGHAETEETSAETNEEPSAARTVVVAVVFGIVTQALFWRSRVGLDFFVWNLVAIGLLVATHRAPRRKTAATAWFAIASALWFGASVVRYASEWSRLIAIPGDFVALALLPRLLREGPAFAELPRILAGLVVSPRQVGTACRKVTNLPVEAMRGERPGWVRNAVVGAAIGVPVTFVFTILLAADDAFGIFVTRVLGNIDEATKFGFLSIVTAVFALLAHTLVSARVERALPASLRGFGPYRQVGNGLAPSTAGRIGLVTWSLVLAQVTGVFGVFVALNLRNLFAGHSIVKAAGGPTYARYLHAGFVQLVVAAGLAVVLVLVGHALLRPSTDSRIPGGFGLKALESTLLVFVGATLASCGQRLSIYVDAYGLSYERLGVAFIELGVGVAVATTIVKAFARTWRGYGGALVASAAALAMAATSLDADALIARTNLDLALGGRHLDAYYLMGLGTDAAPVLMSHPYLAAHPIPAEWITHSVCEEHQARRHGLREWSGLASCPSIPKPTSTWNDFDAERQRLAGVATTP